MKPLVSILITNYNKEKYITYILGVLLEHNTPEIEIILVDDASTDTSLITIYQFLDDLSKYKQDNLVLIIHQKNMGVAYSKQEALDRSTGDFFIYLDGDDFIPEDYVETLLEYAKSGKSLIYNFRTRVYPCGTTVEFDFSLWNKLINKEGIDKYGIKFNTELRNMDDVELWRRISAEHPEIYDELMPVDKILYFYNLASEDTLTHKKSLWYQTMNDIKKECK